MATRTKLPPVPSNGKVAAAPTSVRREIGRTGLRIFSGRIDEEFLRQLQHEKGPQVFREMATNDAVVGAVLTAIELMMRQVIWRVEAKTSEGGNQEVADFVDTCRQDMEHTWEDLLSEILSMLVYGYSIHEEVYKLREPGNSRYPDGKIGWAKLPIRGQETLDSWDSDTTTGEVRGFIQRPPPDYQLRNIPLSKALHFRPWGHKNNPEGASILRRAYEVWYYKKSLMRIEAIGIERDLAGYPVLYGPKGESGAIDAAAESIIQNIRRDEQEGAYLPSARDEKGNRVWELVLLSTGGQRQYDTNAILQRYDTRIAQTMLADFILIGHEKVGSFALSSDKTHLFSVALGAWLDAICAVFNRTAIPRLLALNGIPVEQAPKLMHGDVETVNLLEFGDFISQLAGAGMPLFPDFPLENKIRDLLDIGRLTQDEWDKKQAERKAQLEAQQTQMDAGKPKPNGAPPAARPEPAPAEKSLAPIVLQPHFTIEQAAPLPAPPPIMVQSPVPDVYVTVDKSDPPVVHVDAPRAPDVHVNVEASPPADVTVNVAPSPAPQVTVEAAPVPDVHVTVEPPEAPVVNVSAPNVTVEAPAPVVVPAPQVTVKAPVIKQGDTVINVDAQPIVDAIDRVAEASKRPSEVKIIRDASGQAQSLKPEEPPE